MLVVACLAIVLALASNPPPPPTDFPQRDFEAYYAAGETWHYHGDVYARDVWRTEHTLPGVDPNRDELLPFVSPAFGLPLWAELAQYSFVRARQLWNALLVIAFAIIAIGSFVLVTRDEPERRTVARYLGALVFAGAFAPITSGIALGQVAIVACAAIVLVPLLLRPRGILPATIAAFIAALQPNLAVVLAARLADRRSWIVLVAAALAAVGTSALALGGPMGIRDYLHVLAQHGAAERFLAIQITPTAVARALGASANAAVFLGITIAIVTIAWIVIEARVRGYSPDSRLIVAAAALPLVLPFTHEHDLAVAFLPAIAVTTRARGVRWTTGACASLLVGVDWLGLAQNPATMTAHLFLALATTLALAALSPDRLAPYHFSPALLIALVALMGTLAAAHPIPTWPDALPRGFHVPATLSAPIVWHLEQIASGIGRLDAVSGILRALSLVGCAALALTTSRTVTARRSR